jgi:RNA polymerase sigma-70 factor (ECF subfamily)
LDTQYHRQFAKLFLENQSRIYRFILTLCPNPSEAEELFQQTSLTMWEQWESFDLSKPMCPWAFAIARNHIRNHVHKVARRSVQSLSEEVIERLAETVSQSQQRLDMAVGRLEECMEKLPSRSRMLLLEHYLNQESTRDVARRFNMTANAVYKLLRQARRMLLDCMTRMTLES